MPSDQAKPIDQDQTRTVSAVDQTIDSGETKRGDEGQTLGGQTTGGESIESQSSESQSSESQSSESQSSESQSSASASPDASAPRKTIGKYELRELLGQGGMGAVYLGFDPLIEREVAIKVLPDKLSKRTTALKRFLAEARAAGQLNHPNAIAIYDIGEHDGRHFIVMELARGGSVSGLLSERGRLPLAEACRITIEAARGLAAAHSAGLVHRDVKPENLMLSADGLVKLVDFGLAKAVDRNADLAITQAGDILGTPCYMSPEQIRSEKLDAGRTDVYSLGASFYHLLTGDFPFKGNSIAQMMFAHLEAERPDPRKLHPGLPAECSAIVAKAMAVEPGQRYASMEDLIADLAPLMQGEVDEAIELAKHGTVCIELATPSILIVEPTKLRAKITADLFRKAGCDELECVTTAADALEYARSNACAAVIASRQLADSHGETLLQQIRQTPQSANAMCVLVSSESPQELMAQGLLTGTAAYAKKQANPEELLRAVHACTSHVFDSLTFAQREHGGLRLAILSKEAAIPAEFAGWLREFAVFDVVARPVEEVAEGGLGACNLAVWIDQSSSTEADFSARLIGPIAQTMIEEHSTLAIVGGGGSSFRLRGVKRPSLVAACDQPFDRQCFKNLLDAAS